MAPTFRPRLPRGASHLLALAAGTVAVALTLAGCAGSASGGSTPSDGKSGATDRFDQSLHDLLPARIQDSGTVSFGGLWETPPALGVDPDDPTKPAGIAPELAAEFGKILGVDVTWQNMQWPAQLPGLQAGSVDVLFGQVTITEEREKSIVDLVPWAAAKSSLLLVAGSDAKSFADMCGKTIATAIGSIYVGDINAVSDRDCVGQGKPAIKLAEYQGASPAIQALRAGTVDGWVDQQTSIEAVVKSAPDAFTSAVLSKDEVPTQFSGIAISKDNPGLTKAILGAMEILVKDGTYEKVMKDNDSAAQVLTIDELKINPTTGTPAGEKAAG